MADRIQNLIRRLESSSSMARFSAVDDNEAEIPMTNRIPNRRPRLPLSTSQSQRRSRVQSRRLPVRRSRCQASCTVEEEEDLIPLEVLDADSDEFEAEYGIGDGDEGADVTEAQRQHHQEAPSTAPVPPPRHAISGRGLRRCNAVEAASDNASGAFPVMLTNPDVLDCPICLDPLSSPIYQCDNGHITCSTCCSKIRNKCPSCSLPIASTRCRAMEKLIESVRISCKNSKFGCKETLTYSNKTNHEQTCPHTACYCPLPSCMFTSSANNLYLHFVSRHAAATTSFSYNTDFHLIIERIQKTVFLQERQEGVIFILNHDDLGNSRVFNLNCLGPNTFNCVFLYEITVRFRNTSLSIKSTPDVCAKWQQYTPTSNCLTVPSNSCTSTNGRLLVRLCITNVHSVF